MHNGTQADEPGKVIAGRYRLLERIGRGGMGTVWQAEDEVLQRHVAIKKLHLPPHLADAERATLFERTRREARSAARITHPNVVVVHDVVDDNGLPCIVMEHVPSRALDHVLKNDGPLSPAEAARIGAAMTTALHAAHSAHILHRDVKPANVLLGNDGRVVLTDFGIAVQADASTLTRTGELIGSIDFCAPERVKGTPPGPPSDLWALGATLYQAVEGRPPFRRPTPLETTYAIAVDSLEPPTNAGSLTQLIQQLLAKDPDDRPTTHQTQQQLDLLTTQTHVTAPTTPATAAVPATAAPAAAPSTASTGISAPGLTHPPHQPDPRHHPGQGQVSEPQGGQRGRGRGRRAGLWAAVAVLVVTAALTTAFLAFREQDDTGGNATPEHPPSAQSPGIPGPPPLPDGYRRVHEEKFNASFPVPKGWTRKVLPDENEGIAFIDPTRMFSLRIAALDFANTDHLQRWKNDKEQSIQEGKLPGYRQIRMHRTTYQNTPAAIWEFTWQGENRQWHARDLGFGEPGKTEYAIYLSTPQADWDDNESVFKNVKDGFRVKGN